jgi:hypothetical protein
MIVPAVRDDYRNQQRLSFAVTKRQNADGAAMFTAMIRRASSHNPHCKTFARSGTFRHAANSSKMKKVHFQEGS